MVIQVPGAVFFIISLAVRPGVDWTSWLAYAVTAGMQSALLVSFLCYEYLEVVADIKDPLRSVERQTETRRDR